MGIYKINAEDNLDKNKSYRFHMVCKGRENVLHIIDAPYLKDILPYYNDEQYLEVSYLDKRFNINFVRNNVTGLSYYIQDGEVVWSNKKVPKY